MRKFQFVREEDQRWYVILPEFIEQGGTKGDLEMVMGADDMLDQLSNYTDRVSLYIIADFSTITGSTPFDGTWNELSKTEFNDIGSGAYYVTDGSLNIERIWLCDVMLYIYGEFPEKLYYKKTATY